jgi:hypothetical protein
MFGAVRGKQTHWNTRFSFHYTRYVGRRFYFAEERICLSYYLCIHLLTCFFQFWTSICLLLGTFFFYFVTISTQLTCTTPHLKLAWDAFFLTESPSFPSSCTFVWIKLIILYSISSVFAWSSSYLADMLFGIQRGPKVPQTPKSQHRANQWLGGQDNSRATASSEQPPEVSGHIPGVMKLSK